MAGQFTNSDIKSEAELALDGFGKDKLPHTEKIYDPNEDDTLDNLLFGGALTKPKVAKVVPGVMPGVPSSPAAPQVVAANINVSDYPDAGHIVIFIKSNGGNKDINLANIIGATGFAGQTVEVHGTDDVDTVTVLDGHNGPLIFDSNTIATYKHNGVGYKEAGRNK